MIIRCSNCQERIQFVKLPNFKHFLIFVCPYCECNIIFYEDGRSNVISDKKVKDLEDRGIIRFPYESQQKTKTQPLKKQRVIKKTEPKCQHYITKDDIINLKILLETESDVKKILKKI